MEYVALAASHRTLTPTRRQDVARASEALFWRESGKRFREGTWHYNTIHIMIPRRFDTCVSNHGATTIAERRDEPAADSLLGQFLVILCPSAVALVVQPYSIL